MQGLHVPGLYGGSASSRGEMLSRLEKLSRIVGSTPTRCFQLGRYRLCVKLEYVNPTGSHKDRIALYMIRSAVERGDLGPGGCVAEVSSGNTATSVAWIAWSLGLRPTLFVERMASNTKKSLVRMLGGEVVEIGDEGLSRDWARERAEELGCLLLDQTSNEYNHLAHYETTGVEIVEQVGRVDAFLMGVGTGGTVTGVARRLRESQGSTLVVAVTPRGSRLAGGEGGDTIEGLASRSVPPLYERHRALVDTVVEVSGREALMGVEALASATGLLAGPSTGAAFAAASRLILERAIDPGSTVVIIAADSLARYPELSSSFRLGAAGGAALLNSWLA